jgi:TRAP-type C4-dicarboxylate transport system permease large subunit
MVVPQPHALEASPACIGPVSWTAYTTRTAESAHPPFGFALFYLRGVAPKEVKSSDIYWGALPWVGLQAIMVILVIAFPITVTGLLDKPVNVDLNKVKIEVPQMDLPPLDFGPPAKQ